MKKKLLTSQEATDQFLQDLNSIQESEYLSEFKNLANTFFYYIAHSIQDNSTDPNYGRGYIQNTHGALTNSPLSWLTDAGQNTEEIKKAILTKLIESVKNEYFTNNK